MNNTATTKQIDFINRLKAERIDAEEVLDAGRQLWRLGAFDSAAASATIEALLALPKAKVEAKEPAPEGMHKVGDRIFKVQISPNTGRRYAKELIGGVGYAIGGINLLSAETLMSLEDAKQYGRTYGSCVVCNRVLTDEKSIAAGIGPVCAKRF